MAATTGVKSAAYSIVRWHFTESLVFPRGAYLAGHFQDYHDPGHFLGKGWMQLTFDRLVLPGAVTLPVSAKLISVPHLRVEREGKIHGHGHPKRDAIGWALPILWPVKVVTLPARGPRPTLKGEVRVTLRLLEDVEVPPTVVASRTSSLAPQVRWFRPSSRGMTLPRLRPDNKTGSVEDDAPTAPAAAPRAGFLGQASSAVFASVPSVPPKPSATTSSNASHQQQPTPSQNPSGGVLGVSGADWEEGGVSGVEILEVAPDSSAELAGLHIHEIITHVNGRRIRSTEDLDAVLAQSAPGSKVTLGYMFKSNLGWMPTETVAILAKED